MSDSLGTIIWRMKKCTELVTIFPVRYQHRRRALKLLSMISNWKIFFNQIGTQLFQKSPDMNNTIFRRENK